MAQVGPRTVTRLRPLFWFAAMAVDFGACSTHEQVVAVVEPAIVDEAVESDPNSSIVAVLSVQTAHAQSIRIEMDGEPDGPRVTPDVLVAGGSARVPLLGLYPDTGYRFRAIATAESGLEVAGPWIQFRSSPLPGSIATFEVMSTSGLQPGLTLLAPWRSNGSAHPAVIIDRSGRVVWYREVDGTLNDLQLQPNGHVTGAVRNNNAPSPYAGAAYREWDVLGNLVRTWIATGLDVTDSHELRLLDDDSALLFGYQSRTFDLSRFDGPENAPVIGNVLQRVRPDGTLAFEWNTFDHFALDEADDFVWQSPGAAGYDFTHCNAIEMYSNGDFLVSARDLSEITRIDGQTGAIRWRMGAGKGNQFTFVDDPKGGFWNMHAVRRLPNGHLILIDNGLGHTPPSSRAVEYDVDEDAMTATLVWSFEPGVVSCCGGYAQRLANGNTLVSLGQDYRVSEVSPTGVVVWEARLPAQGAGFMGIYRAFRLNSLDELK